MAQEPTPSNDITPDAPHDGSLDDGDLDLDTLSRSDTLTDERAVELLRRWIEDAQKDPATHTYFPSVARIFFQVLAHEAERVKERASRDTDRRKSYTTQPVGIPTSAPVALAGEEVYDVFNAVLDAVQSWTTDDHVLPNNEAHRRLLRHLDALRTMTNAVIAADAPLVEAHLADARAAEDWRHDRWMARDRRDRECDAARTGATTAQERQRGAEGSTNGDEGSTNGADRDAGAATAPAPPANAGDARSA